MAKIYQNRLFNHAELKDKAAFSRLYDSNWEMLFLYVVRILKNQDDAEDIVQETFSTIWELRKDLSHVACLEAYLLTIAKNKALKHIQLNAKKYINQDSLIQFTAANTHSPEEDYIAEELSVLIDAEVANLPSKMQTVFNLSRIENLSYKEIAEELGISDKTVKKQINNSLKSLRLRIK